MPVGRTCTKLAATARDQLQALSGRNARTDVGFVRKDGLTNQVGYVATTSITCTCTAVAENNTTAAFLV